MDDKATIQVPEKYPPRKDSRMNIRTNITKELVEIFSSKIEGSQTNLAKPPGRLKSKPIQSSDIIDNKMADTLAPIAEKSLNFDSDTSTEMSDTSCSEILLDSPVSAKSGLSTGASPVSGSQYSKNDAKIKKVVEELLATEIAYVDRISMLDKIFRQHFLEKADPNERSYPSVKTIEDMFSSLVSIVGFHNAFFLPSIRERVANWTPDSQIGDIFIKFAPHFKLYTVYCQSYDHSVGIINNASKRFSKFANDLQTIEKKPECKNLRLTHHMLDIIQRIPRYNLLLNELLKHSDSTTDKYKNIKEALDLMSAAAQKANDRLRESQNAMKMLDIQNLFADTLKIVTAGRSFIKQGDMVRKNPKNGKFLTCHLILFNDYIICCSKHSATKYRKKMDFEFSSIGLLKNVQDDKAPNAFGLSNLNETLYLGTATPEEKIAWVTAIEDAILTHDDKITSFLVKNKNSSADFNSTTIQSVMVSYVFVKQNGSTDWENRYLSLTSENKLVLSPRVKIDISKPMKSVDECKVTKGEFDGIEGIEICFASPEETNQIISKHDDLFVPRWFDVLKCCQTRTRSRSMR